MIGEDWYAEGIGVWPLWIEDWDSTYGGEKGVARTEVPLEGSDSRSGDGGAYGSNKGRASVCSPGGEVMNEAVDW